MVGLRGPVAGTDKRGGAFLIRDLAPRDHDALVRMYDDFEPKRIAQGLPPEDPGRRGRWLASVLPRGRHLVVEVDGQVRGHGMIIPFDDSRAELANFLHQSVRDRGIGTALNRALLDAAREEGVRRIWLCVEPTNRAAVRSYEKVGLRMRPVTAWATEVEMELDL